MRVCQSIALSQIVRKQSRLYTLADYNNSKQELARKAPNLQDSQGFLCQSTLPVGEPPWPLFRSRARH